MGVYIPYLRFRLVIFKVGLKLSSCRYMFIKIVSLKKSDTAGKIKIKIHFGGFIFGSGALSYGRSAL